MIPANTSGARVTCCCHSPLKGTDWKSLRLASWRRGRRTDLAEECVWRHDFQGWFWHINPCSYCRDFRQSSPNTESCNGYLLDKSPIEGAKKPPAATGAKPDKYLREVLAYKSVLLLS